jgi:hypothetical protein
LLLHLLLQKRIAVRCVLGRYKRTASSMALSRVSISPTSISTTVTPFIAATATATAPSAIVAVVVVLTLLASFRHVDLQACLVQNNVAETVEQQQVDAS